MVGKTLNDESFVKASFCAETSLKKSLESIYSCLLTILCLQQTTVSCFCSSSSHFADLPWWRKQLS